MSNPNSSDSSSDPSPGGGNNNNDMVLNLRKVQQSSLHSGDAELMEFLKHKKPPSRLKMANSRSAIAAIEAAAEAAEAAEQSRSPMDIIAKKVQLKIASYPTELDERRVVTPEVNKLHQQVSYQVANQAIPLVFMEVENKKIVVQTAHEAQVVRPIQMARVEPTKFETIDHSTGSETSTNTTENRRKSSQSSLDNNSLSTPKSGTNARVRSRPSSVVSFKSGGFKLSSPNSVSTVTSIDNKQKPTQKPTQQQQQTGPKNPQSKEDDPNAHKLQDFLQKHDYYQTPKYPKLNEDTSSLNQKLLDSIGHNNKVEAKPVNQAKTQPDSTVVDDSQFIRLANIALDCDDITRYNPNAIGVLLIYDPNQNWIQLPRVYVQNNFLGIMLNTYNLQHIFGSNLIRSTPTESSCRCIHPNTTATVPPATTNSQSLIDLVNQPNSSASQLSIKLVLFDDQYHPPRQYPFATICNDRRIQLPPPPYSSQINENNQHQQQPAPSIDDNNTPPPDLMLRIQSKFPIFGTLPSLPPPPFPPNSCEVIEIFGFFNDI